MSGCGVDGMRNSRAFVSALLVVGLVLLMVVATSRPAAGVETTYQDPLTAAPPIVRPDTASCRVTLADRFAFGPSGHDVPAPGTYCPPDPGAPPCSMVARV